MAIQSRQGRPPFHAVPWRHIAFNGGGYFRLMPYGIIRKWTQECGEYCLSYIHPRDLDTGQPIEGEASEGSLSGYPPVRKVDVRDGDQDFTEQPRREGHQLHASAAAPAEPLCERQPLLH